MANSATLRRNSNPIKKKFREVLILSSVVIIILLLVYIYIDSSVSREYVMLDSKSQVDSSYRSKFQRLIHNIEEGYMTGIPSYDDAGVMYGDTITITKGRGEFANIREDYNTSSKSYTAYNNFNWNSTSEQYTFAYSSLLHENSVLYNNSGVVKLYDRYVWSAIGTYWSEAFGLNANTGQTYRVYLDTGINYDIICFDVKNPGDELILNSVSNNKSIGHLKGTAGTGYNVCITEFNVIDFSRNYPTRSASGSRPEMKYDQLFDIRTDSSHNVNIIGSYNVIPEFRGNVIAIQLINDPAVQEIFSNARQEVSEYR